MSHAVVKMSYVQKVYVFSIPFFSCSLRKNYLPWFYGISVGSLSVLSVCLPPLVDFVGAEFWFISRGR